MLVKAHCKQGLMAWPTGICQAQFFVTKMAAWEKCLLMTRDALRDNFC